MPCASGIQPGGGMTAHPAIWREHVYVGAAGAGRRQMRRSVAPTLPGRLGQSRGSAPNVCFHPAMSGVPPRLAVILAGANRRVLTHFHRQTLATFSAELDVVLSIDGLATPQHMEIVVAKETRFATS